MSRDSGGTYTPPGATNPVVTGTTISTTWGNGTVADVATALTDSLDRQGRGGMLAPLRGPNGNAAAPAVSFTSETGSGLYRAGAGDIRLSVGGVDVVQLEDDKVTLPLDVTAEGDARVEGELTVVSGIWVTGGISASGAVALPTTTTIAPVVTALGSSTGWNFSSGGGYAFYVKEASGAVRVEASGTYATGGGSNPFNNILPADCRPYGTSLLVAGRAGSGGGVNLSTLFPISVNSDGTFSVSGMTDGDSFFLNASFHASN